MTPTPSTRTARQTTQRRAIHQAFESTRRPLGPQEVLEIAKKSVPRLGIATVYRALKAMVEEGELQVVELPGAPSRYELAGMSHHHHFHCRDCDRVFDVEGCPDQVKEYTPPGFLVEAHEVVLYGLCASCVSSA